MSKRREDGGTKFLNEVKREGHRRLKMELNEQRHMVVLAYSVWAPTTDLVH